MLSSLSWNLWESTIYFSSGADGDQWVRLALFEHTDVVRARRHCCSMAAANKPSFYGNNSWFSGGCVSWRVDSCIVKSVASKVWVWQRIAANVTHVWAFNMVVKQGARVYPASNWWMLCLCQSATKTSSFEHACVETEAAWWLFIDNPCLVCSPFNADFDDDTMVMHLTLSNQSQSWLQDLMSSSRNFVWTAHRWLVVGSTQDMVLDIYNLTAHPPSDSTEVVDLSHLHAVSDAFQTSALLTVRLFHTVLYCTMKKNVNFRHDMTIRDTLWLNVQGIPRHQVGHNTVSSNVQNSDLLGKLCAD